MINARRPPLIGARPRAVDTAPARSRTGTAASRPCPGPVLRRPDLRPPGAGSTRGFDPACAVCADQYLVFGPVKQLPNRAGIRVQPDLSASKYKYEVWLEGSLRLRPGLSEYLKTFAIMTHYAAFDVVSELVRATISRMQIGRPSALECLSRRSRSLFAQGEGYLSLPKPVRSAILTVKPPAPGERLSFSASRARLRAAWRSVPSPARPPASRPPPAPATEE